MLISASTTSYVRSGVQPKLGWISIAWMYGNSAVSLFSWLIYSVTPCLWHWTGN